MEQLDFKTAIEKIDSCKLVSHIFFDMAVSQV